MKQLYSTIPFSLQLFTIIMLIPLLLPAQESPILLPADVPAATEQLSPPAEGLQRYGTTLFQSLDFTQDVITGGALPPDYQLGPGDQLGIFLGGKVQQEFKVTVSVDGQLVVPTVGVLFVGGMTLEEFQKVLNEKLSAVYSDYTLNIMLILPKMVGVSVIGEVQAPGNYSGSALGSVVDFVARAKGITRQGSFRNIQVFRHDSLFACIDLYDFMLRPQGGQDFSLQSGDVIFVPIVSSTIEVIGEVNREAVYELNPLASETVCDVIELAGGFTRFAYTSRIELSRFRDDGTRKLTYLDLSNEDCSDTTTNIELMDKDVIRAFSILDQAPRDSVTIHGEVNEPGTYEFQHNMRVSDLILQAGSLKRSAYVLEAEVAKVDPGNQVFSVKLDLQKIRRGNSEEDILLEADDHVFIRKIPDWEIGALVEVGGEVRFPGIYPIIVDSTRLSDVLREAGGFTDEALIREARLIRQRDVFIEDKEFERLSTMSRADMSESEYEYFVMKHNSDNVNHVVVDFYELMVENNPREDVLLIDGDLIHVPKRPEVVYVSGRVSNPGGVLYKPEAEISYYIDKAGGYTWDARKRKTKIIKVTGEIRRTGQVRELEPGDRIFVPRKQDHDYWRTFYDFVVVLGQLAAVYLVIRTAAE